MTTKTTTTITCDLCQAVIDPATDDRRSHSVVDPTGKIYIVQVSPQQGAREVDMCKSCRVTASKNDPVVTP